MNLINMYLNEASSKPELAIDFDQTIFKYSKGWHDGSMYDPPIDGVESAFKKLSSKYSLVIFTARITSGNSINKTQVNNIKQWLEKYNLSQYVKRITNIKSPSMVAFIDDRAISFNNNWDEIARKL